MSLSLVASVGFFLLLHTPTLQSAHTRPRFYRLSTDFTSERKRHFQSRRKLSNGVLQYFKTRSSRALAAWTQAESKRRRLAARMGRLVRNKWWGKMDQIVTYQQRVTYDQERNQAMNRKLVKLVQQTEHYTKSLVGVHKNKHGGDKDKEDEENDQQLHQWRIEQALAVGQRKRKVHDYARLAQLEQQEQQDTPADNNNNNNSTSLYGESTTDDSMGSDGSYEPGSDSSVDDETTLAQAEREEQEERRSPTSNTTTHTQQQRQDGSPYSSSFVADPLELEQLQEEATLDIQLVLERLQQEPPTLFVVEEDPHPPGETLPNDNNDDDKEKLAPTERRRNKQVHFASETKPDQKKDSSNTQRTTTTTTRNDPGEDADDDGDVSDVDDFRMGSVQDLAAGHMVQDKDDDDDAQEYVDDGVAVDDETTMEEEEGLPQEMTAQQEIALLEEENNLSIEELRARYAIPTENTNPPDNLLESTKDDTSNEESADPSIPHNDDDGATEESEDAEFEPEPGGGVDDETTIEAEEKLGRDMSYEDELALLKQENEIPVEELRNMYARMQAETESTNVDDEEEDNDSGEGGDATQQEESSTNHLLENDCTKEDLEDGEFEPNPTERDDETTIEAEERLGREMSYEDELALLKSENEMSVEELRAMYAGAFEESEKKDETGSEDTMTEATGQEKEGSHDDSQDGSEVTDTRRRSKRQRAKATDAETPSKRPRKEGEATVGTSSLSALEQYAELAKSTLATRPFLLASWVKLREYQQIGLNWLISLQSRRLNGILADEVRVIKAYWLGVCFRRCLQKSISRLLDGLGQNFADNCVDCVFGRIQGNLGPTSDRCPHISHCQLGD